jgi:DMSO/TMAO reductase YedYZ heme-binding membrane subunit
MAANEHLRGTGDPMSSLLPWYIDRAAGLVSWTILTASVVWGLSISTKTNVPGRRPRPNWMLDLHRFLGGLATIFTLVHVAAILVDSYIHFDLVSVLVPFASTWRPVAVAWGVAGLYLLMAVELTSLARKHLSKRVWRMTHFASFPLFVVATVHGLTAGTDAGTWLFEAAVAVATLVIGGLTVVRIRQSQRPPSPRGRSVVAARPWPFPGPAASDSHSMTAGIERDRDRELVRR